MVRKPAFWVLFFALSIAAVVFTIKNFSTAFPLVSVDVRMDRDGALKAARGLAEKNAWPPAGFDQAAEFSGDQESQNFIELEGGGKPELGRIVKEKIFSLYTWRVRHFKESDAHETLLRYTPDGQPYGFRVKLPEKEAGDTVAPEAAQQTAETAAKDDWGVDLTRYRLVESSKDVRPGGRTDHTFVYERQDERIREGRYRLRLVVGGNKLTELTHFIQIPEAFTRRYEELRSANTAIGAASTIAIFGLYLLGCCGIGLFFMMRRRWVLVRQAIFWGVLIALLMGLDQLNSWSLLWMGYDTAVSASGFALRQVGTALGVFGGFAILLAITFMAAETLSRRAFPHHVQFWKVWSAPVAASKPILGQTLTGYLLVSLFFAYEIVLYFFAQGTLGWWTPSDTLVNPNVWASYFPFLSAISQAAQAGFWEECLFRAAPLATAALIGDRYGKRRAFLAVAMVLQALIFASGHAGYANQPAYARVVELIIPSFAFGGLYLAFGLLPGIVLHYAYDTVWIALPLFVSSTGRARVEQAIVILLVLVPLWAVVLGRIRARRWTEVPEEYLDGAWKPTEVEAPPEMAPVVVEATPVSPLVSKVLPIAGLVGLVLWIASANFRTDVPAISITRAEAEQNARQALAQRSVQLDASWEALARVEGQPGQGDRFVWQKTGREKYRALVGSYLAPPHWVIRFARFQGDVAERAEEYQVAVDGSGKVYRIAHDLPEARPGKSLTVDEARVIARMALTTNFDVPLDSVKEVSAEAGKRPARVDWTFVFSDTRDYGLPEGEPRISVEIAGDEVSDAARYIYVPEEWARNERRDRNLPSIFGVVCSVAIIGILFSGAVFAIVRWSRKHAFSVKAFLAFSVLVFLLSVINLLNSWPVIKAQLSTAQPLMLQAGVVIGVSLLLAVFTALAQGLIAGLVVGADDARPAFTPGKTLLLGAALGAAMAGLSALARALGPSVTPAWGSFGGAAALVPILSAALSPISQFITQTLLLLLVFRSVGRRSPWPLFLIFLGLLISGASSVETITSWLITGAAVGTVLILANAFVLRHQVRLLVGATAMLSIMATLRDGIQQSYPAALPGAIAGVILIGAVAVVWLRSSMNTDVTEAKSNPLTFPS